MRGPPGTVKEIGKDCGGMDVFFYVGDKLVSRFFGMRSQYVPYCKL